MKVLFPASIALVAMVACTPQPPPQSPPSPQGTLNQQWTGGGSGRTVVAGSAGNTTTAFDGTYKGLSNRSESAAGTGKKTFEPTTTGCQQFDEPPPVTITNGLAEFQALGATFAGYVTPQGHVRMSSGYGAAVEADIDAQTHILRGRASSTNCRYDLSWQKVA
jgi:hypothetical protein